MFRLVAKTRYYTIAFFLAFLLTSCSVQLNCILHNNTTFEVSIVKQRLSGIKEKFHLLPGNSIELSGWTYNDYIITFNNTVWRYDPPAPSLEFVEMSGFGPWIKRLVYAQLEEDGRIFIYKKGERPPNIQETNQPEGYPLIAEVMRPS